MAITGIKRIDFYSTQPSKDSLAVKQYLEKNKIEYNRLNYNDPAQWPDVFAALRTWWPDGEFDEVDSFPFITYIEVDGEKEQTRFIHGLKDIKASNLPELYALGK